MYNLRFTRRLSYLLMVIIIVLFLDACTTLPSTPDSSLMITPTITSVNESTVPYISTPTVESTPTINVPSTVSPTALPETPLPTLPIGWVWYQSVDGVYAIAYPQQWQVQNSGAGGIIFSSLDTGSQIRISRRTVPTANEVEGNAAALPDAPSATATPTPPTCTNWLTSVSTHQSDFPGVPVGLDMTFNATFSGQPAFFHFSPAPGGGGGASAVLLFCTEGTIVSPYFQSASDALVPEEATIYQQMIASLMWRGDAAAPLDIPTTWMTGETLVILWPQLEPALLSAEEQLFYETGFEATVIEFEAGTFEVMTDGGEVMRVRGRSYTFSRSLSLGQESAAAAPFLEPGDRVFLVGYPVTAPGGEPFFTAQYLAVERDGAWQTVGFQTTFDLSYEQLTPNLLQHYPQDQPLRLRFLGTLAQLLPYLVNTTGQPLTEADLQSVSITQQVLAYGILFTPESPQLQLEELYALEGVCYPIAEIERDCYPWQRVYPASSS